MKTKNKLMNEQITASSYRENKKREFEKVRATIDKHYLVLWEMAKEFQEVSPNEPFRVETHYGHFQFVPQIKLKYEL